MFSKLFRFLRLFFQRSRTINNEPLNKVSLIVIILIDVFILTNVFLGLNDIAWWPIPPSSQYPCYVEWSDYREQTTGNKDLDIVRRAVSLDIVQLQRRYQQSDVDHLGEVNAVCSQYGERQSALRKAGYGFNLPPAAEQENDTSPTLLQQIAQKEDAIASLKKTNRTIRDQYDSTLLEEIAQQSREQSINFTSAAEAKIRLTENEAKINALEADITALENELLAKPESQAFLNLLKQESAFQTVERGYNQAKFWHPTIQLGFQTIFLVPLIFIAFIIHKLAQKKRYGLISLISWHLLVIFFIPLAIKLFEFMQVGFLFNVVFDIVSALIGELLFLVSYIYILLIPLLGFGVIKLAQRFIFNPKLQAAGRVQNSRCIKCAKKIKDHDAHCPHCGYYQHRECHHCHQLTYKYLPHCNQCGAAQALRS